MRTMIALIVVTFLSFQAWAQVTITGEVTPLGEDKKMFDYKGVRTFTKTDMDYVGEYKDLEGNVVVSETAKISNGTIITYVIDAKQTKEKGKIYSKDGKLHFEYKPRKGKKEKTYVKLKPNTLVSANLIPYAQDNFAKLEKGETINFNYAVWYRKETIGFRFVKDSEDEKTMTIKMSPSNLLYRSLVNPLYYTLDKKTKNLLHSKGRVIPKRKSGRRHKSLDATVKYTYK